MSDFRLVYPGANRVMHDGGKNNKFERSIIADEESPDCANVRFKNGGVETRGGTTKLNTAAIGSFVGDGLYTRHNTTGTETMIAWAGGSAWQLATTTFSTIGSAQSVFTAGQRVGSTEYENHIFFGNGGTLPYKYNGTDFTRHGVYPPTATPTVTSNAIGTLTGGYRYKMTAVNSQLAESDVGPVSVTFTAASATLRVTLQTFAASFGISTRRLYRTSAAGGSFYRVATISDYTTVTFDDKTLDSALGILAPTDNGVPPLYNTVITHQDRLFMNDTANPGLLWYSELGEPYTVKSTSFIPMGDATSDLLRGIIRMENNILASCDKSQFLIYMPDTDPTTWNSVRMQSPFGTRSPYGMFPYDNNIMFPAVRDGEFAGFAAVSGIGVQPSATFLTVSTAGSLLQSDRIEPDMFNVQKTYLGNISSIVFKNRAYISLTYDVSNTKNNRIYVYDFSYTNLSKSNKASWSPDTGVAASQFTIYGGNLYFISSNADGFVHQYETSLYSDNGTAIDSYFWTKEFSAEKDAGGMSFKDFRYVKTLIDLAGAYFMNFFHRVDSDQGAGNVVAVDLNPGGSLWGTAILGTSLWGGGAAQQDVKIFLGQDRGERIQFKYSNQNVVNQKFKSHGLRFFFNRKGSR